MTDLTRNQAKRLRSDRVLANDVIEVALALRDGGLETAHIAAASNTTSDSPAASQINPGSRPSGHSDPTASAVLADDRTSSHVDDLHRELQAWLQVGYDIVKRCHEIARPTLGRDIDDPPDEKLDTANRGEGTCDACGIHCTGKGNDRLRTIRPGDGHTRPLSFCDQHRQAWKTWLDGHLDADVYHWCDQVRRGITHEDAA